MSFFRTDRPSLLEFGVHPMTLQELKKIGVDAFPLSLNRPKIFAGFSLIVGKLETLTVECEIIIDGSFLTEEIEPMDIDSTVCVSHLYFDSCPGPQYRLLEWIRDDFSIKRSYYCDINLYVDYPKEHPEYFEGIQSKEYWVKLFSESVIYKRQRGIAVLALSYGKTAGITE